MRRISILIVDDDPVVRHMLPAYFHGEGFHVAGVAASATEALEELKRTGIDVVLADVRMPEVGGIDFVRHMRDIAPHVPVVGITSFDEDECGVEMLRAGARGMVLKSASKSTIQKAVTDAARGRTFVDSDVAGRLGRYLTPVRLEADRPELTAREQEVLELLLEGMSNGEISAALGVTVPTVKKHVTALFGKFGVETRLKLVIAALR